MTIDLNALREQHEKLNKTKKTNGNSDDFLKKFYAIKDGKNSVRILPSTDEDNPNQFYAHTKIHRIPLDNGRTKNYHCRGIHGESCPLCDLYRELWNEPYGRESDKKLARKIKARDRFYLNVVDREAQENGEENIVKILSVPVTLFDSIVGAMIDETEPIDLVDMDEGHDFVISKKEVEGYPKYDGSQPRIKPSKIGTDQEKAIALAQRHDIQSLVKLYDYDEGKELAENLRPDLSLDRFDTDDIES